MHSVAVGHGALSLEALSVYEPQLSIQHFSQLQAWLGRTAAIEFPG